MKRRIVRLSLALSAATALLCLVGAIYQIVGTSSDSRRFRQQDRSVDIENLMLNIDCKGQGRPTVILDSGRSVPAIGWFQVQPEVAKFTRVCSYDRAGYGWSDSGPVTRTSMQIAKELKALLDAAGENGPYVTVGQYTSIVLFSFNSTACVPSFPDFSSLF
jgi:pimeloyl-ACP methyl ester carboxylesterase